MNERDEYKKSLQEVNDNLNDIFPDDKPKKDWCKIIFKILLWVGIGALILIGGSIVFLELMFSAIWH